MKTLSPSLKAEAIAQSKAMLERLNSGQLTRFELSNLDELPPTSGIYFAITEDGTVLYIGKASKFVDRCVVKDHHKLPMAVAHGAVALLIESVPTELVWHVEQWLIGAINPSLNDTISHWWGRPSMLKQRRKRSPLAVTGLASRLVAALTKEAEQCTDPMAMFTLLLKLTAAQMEIAIDNLLILGIAADGCTIVENSKGGQNYYAMRYRSDSKKRQMRLKGEALSHARQQIARRNEYNNLRQCLAELYCTIAKVEHGPPKPPQAQTIEPQG